MARISLAAALLIGCISTSAAAMDVATFLTKAEAAKKKGMLAIFSSDARLLMGEIKGASNGLKAERSAAKAAGAQPAYCPTGGGSLSQDELLATMRSIPAEARSRASVKDALRIAFVRKFPCAK